ncbi:hypothetical protein CYMTET_51465 [Cymbomonas tetramitiformis]|uniref:NADP-dependent oxidoreductase domain-containing protein n=1 Tax=Cymbomonas tetramitiformis TaxID=36881 RepID=A0AAE0ESB5_9CHLO|nr:hypothetical protein CYMTET_51465 [Cymbomonas tetramitiformis]
MLQTLNHPSTHKCTYIKIRCCCSIFNMSSAHIVMTPQKLFQLHSRSFDGRQFPTYQRSQMCTARAQCRFGRNKSARTEVNAQQNGDDALRTTAKQGAVLDRRELLAMVAAAQQVGQVAGSPALAGELEAPSAAFSVPSVQLNNGLAFPLASFGLQVYDDNTAKELTLIALEVGYRNFFASVLARNQRGFARAVAESGVPRDELFICGSVLSNRPRAFDSAYQATARQCQENLEAFAEGGIDYVDMIMLDYPGPTPEAVLGQWKGMEEMLAAGTTRSLAVSNFSPAQLDCILDSDPGATVPAVNQLPYNVAFHRPGVSSFDIIEENRSRGVLVQAWAPLGGTTGGLSQPVRRTCQEIGEKYGKSLQQVALRWILQTGVCFSTQTKVKQHFVEDLEVFDFELSADEMAELSNLA